VCEAKQNEKQGQFNYESKVNIHQGCLLKITVSVALSADASFVFAAEACALNLQQVLTLRTQTLIKAAMCTSAVSDKRSKHRHCMQVQAISVVESDLDQLELQMYSWLSFTSSRNTVFITENIEVFRIIQNI